MSDLRVIFLAVLGLFVTGGVALTRADAHTVRVLQDEPPVPRPISLPPIPIGSEDDQPGVPRPISLPPIPIGSEDDQAEDVKDVKDRPKGAKDAKKDVPPDVQDTPDERSAPKETDGPAPAPGPGSATLVVDTDSPAPAAATTPANTTLTDTQQAVTEKGEAEKAARQETRQEGGDPHAAAVEDGPGAFIDPDSLPGCIVVDGGTEPDCSFGNPGWAWGLIQVLSLMAVYAMILFAASNMLSSGSELLLMVPSVSGIVGSVVLPVLGAVPDGAIMLFSGLGPDAQENLNVGVGALAGSTIMLLTIPWSLSILLGSVPIDKGVAVYSRRREKVQPCALASYGVSPDATIRSNAFVMVATASLYLIIQGPAFQFATRPEYLTEPKARTAAHSEHWFALAGLVLAVLAFVAYLFLMVQQSKNSAAKEYRINAVALKALEGGSMTLSGIVAPIIAAAKADAKDGKYDVTMDSGAKEKLAALLRPQFTKYDVDGDKKLNVLELRALLSDVGERLTMDETRFWMEKLDPDHSGEIDENEFLDMVLGYIREKIKDKPAKFQMHPEVEKKAEDEDEEDEMPEELKHLSPEQQQTALKWRAAMLCGFGMLLILVFSDPMVDAMASVGLRLGVPGFYIAFVLAPLASNASELVASLLYAQKKSQKTITVSLSALEGAACMNNTFCLAIFMALIYFQGLVWKFSAETLAILLVEILVAGVALQPTQRLYHALFVFALYPFSICFIALVEEYGLD